MHDHTKALVPLETWTYYSPEVRHQKRLVDIGLFTEALIYYDNLHINVSTPTQMAAFIEWFVKQDRFKDLLSLLDDGILNIYHYAFHTGPVQADGSWAIWNIQDEEQSKRNTFEERILYSSAVSNSLPHARHRKRLFQACRQNVVEVKSELFGPAVENARSDYLNPERSALIVQSLVDHVYPLFSKDKPPKISAQVTNGADNKHFITWNVNFESIGKVLGENLKFNEATPLAAAAICNKLIWSAAGLGSDLFLASPMATLVGDKIYESNSRILGSKEITDQLKAEVEFPNIQQLVNSGTVGLADILKIRDKAKRFRRWLQTTSERDINAIVAYHKEVSEELGLLKFGRKSLRLFGVVGGVVAPQAIMGALAGIIAQPEAAIAGGMVGVGIKYLCDVVSKIGEGWRPVVFGDWMSGYIRRIINKE